MRRRHIENFLRESNRIVSIEFVRETDQKLILCPTCEAELARHDRKWICGAHGRVANPLRRRGVRKGETQTMQGRSKYTRKAMKNWTEVAGGQGQRFNAATAEDAQRIEDDNGLIPFVKFSKTDHKEMGGVWRLLKLANIVAVNGELVTE